jgi:pSer/pThr/pTyr-binding forkhead associated (FHA) protein
MHFTLQGLDTTTPSFHLTLGKTPVRIGRHPELDVRLDDPSVSRFHCQIDQINGTLWVRDLGSSCGIFVNGFHIPQSHLMPGDRLTIGTLSFRVDYARVKRGAPAAVKPQAEAVEVS